MQRVRKQIEVPEQEIKILQKGVTVAVLDSGIEKHPDLAEKVLCFRDFVNGQRLMYDDNGHGTHVCGIICGDGSLSKGRFCGMAPASKLVVGKVLDRNGDGTAENMISALEWILSIQKKYKIKVLNISVGIGIMNKPEKERLLQRRIDELWDNGMVVVCAAGNKGPGNNTISAVSASRKVITVGCHDGEFGKDNPGRCESYSGRGSAFATIRKPDIVAPGTDIMSCCSSYQKKKHKDNSAYVTKSGTSMATPIVTGALALALQKFPEMSNEELKQKLTYTATDLGEVWNKQGWGMVNVKRLLE